MHNLVTTVIVNSQGHIVMSHMAKSNAGVDKVILVQTMDIVAAAELSIALDDAINVIHTKHANSLPDKTFNVPSGRSHA